MKLNVGCGRKHKKGFINIDGDPSVDPDRVMIFPEDRLSDVYRDVSLITADDFIEHFHHWEAVDILKDWYRVLGKEGKLILKTPCLKRLLTSKKNLNDKARWLYGGQDICSGGKSDNLRQEHPEFFCHHYIWTEERLKIFLDSVKLEVIRTDCAGVNMILTSIKE